MRRPAEPSPIWVALPGMRLRQATPVFRVVADERASYIVDIEHGARVALQRCRDWVDVFCGYFTALPDSFRDVHNRVVDLVRNLQDMAVRDRSFHRVAVEQRAAPMTAQN